MTKNQVTTEYLETLRRITGSEMNPSDQWKHIELAKKTYELELRLMEVQ